MFDVLEHIEDTTDFLQEINRVMKPGSLLFLTVPAFIIALSTDNQAVIRSPMYALMPLCCIHACIQELDYWRGYCLAFTVGTVPRA